MHTKTDKNGASRTFLDPKEVNSFKPAKQKQVAAPPAGIPVPRNRLSVAPSVWLAVYMWAVNSILAPQLIQRARSWLVYFPVRVRSFLSAILGPRVDDSVYLERMGICLSCPEAKRVLVKKAPFVKTYCGSCRCPNWPLSDMAYKNELKNAGCPMGKFSGKEFPKEWSKIKDEEAENVMADAMERSGCGKPGCNGVH